MLPNRGLKLFKRKYLLIQSNCAKLCFMETQKAVNQLAEIYAQISKTELYRGFRAKPVAITGLAALLSIFLQPYWVAPGDRYAFVEFWVFIAIANGLFMGSILAHRYLYRDNHWERHKTHNMLMQFGPTLLAGAMVTFVAYRFDPHLICYLPGIWSLTFALGIIAARAYLSNHLFWCGMYYLLASMFLLTSGTWSLSPWGMGLTFGVGQLLVATVMYWDIERYEN